MKKFKQALVNPASVFAKPNEVVFTPALSRNNRSMCYVVGNMTRECFKWGTRKARSTNPAEILESLHQLDYWPDLKRSRIED